MGAERLGPGERTQRTPSFVFVEISSGGSWAMDEQALTERKRGGGGGRRPDRKPPPMESMFLDVSKAVQVSTDREDTAVICDLNGRPDRVARVYRGVCRKMGGLRMLAEAAAGGVPGRLTRPNLSACSRPRE